MGRRLKIVVGGYIVGFPLGGMTWHHLHYLLGLHDLGHEVWFLEDSPHRARPYDPRVKRVVDDPSYGIAYLEETLERYGLPKRYCYYSEGLDRHYGLSEAELADVLGAADLLLCVSGVTAMRDTRPRARRTAVIDTDPVFTQIRMIDDAAFRAYYLGFDAMATFGHSIGQASCTLPTHDIDWLPTRQPVSLPHWPVTPSEPGRHFTTVGKWSFKHRDVVLGQETYRSSKGSEWLKLLELPGSVPWTMEMAMLSMPSELRTRFATAGWTISDAEHSTRSPSSFQEFVNRSAGELTVAKELYASVPSGWFSDRSAAYLAAGRPVVTQSTGFEAWLPVGEGLFPFRTAAEAIAALHDIAHQYERHCRAARALAEEYFDARNVLSSLLERIGV